MNEEANHLDDVAFDSSSKQVRDLAGDLSFVMQEVATTADRLAEAFGGEFASELERSNARLVAAIDLVDLVADHLNDQALADQVTRIRLTFADCPDALEALPDDLGFNNN